MRPRLTLTRSVNEVSLNATSPYTNPKCQRGGPAIATPNARPIRPSFQPSVSHVFFASLVPRSRFKGQSERNSKSQLDLRMYLDVP